MSNTLSNELLAQLFAQESSDPFLALITLSHSSFSSDIRLVNNTKDIISRGLTFVAFPVSLRLPVDDGERVREVSMELDNASLDLINSFRSITTQIGVKIELILASIPDQVQMSLEDLKINTISYNKTKISANLIIDNFFNTEMTSERYGPQNFPGLF